MNFLKTMSRTAEDTELDIRNKAPENPNANVQVYKRRYWMLFLFSFISLLSGMLCSQYISMANVMGCYYDVTQDAINWTVLIVMLVYVVLVFPVSWLINYMDLRWTVICGAFCNTTACVIQFKTLKPDGYSYVMASAFFASLSNMLVLAVPPFLAAKWFPTKELSRACAYGVFANQLGLAVGFIFSPLLVSNNCELKKDIEEGKLLVAIYLTAVNSVVLILVFLTFQNSPKFPPSVAQAQKEVVSSNSYITIVLNMLKNKDFVLIFIMYGLMVGTEFAFVTTLNDRMLRYFPDTGVEIGWMGTLFTVIGLVGSILIGYILDYTHKFKHISSGICISSFLTLCILSFLLYVDKLWVQFITIGIFGFFLTSFLPVGLEYGIEVTYPDPEVISASLLNASTNLFGIIITEVASHVLDDIGPISSNVVICVTLLIACVISSFITTDYKRSRKNEENISNAV